MWSGGKRRKRSRSLLFSRQSKVDAKWTVCGQSFLARDVVLALRVGQPAPDAGLKALLSYPSRVEGRQAAVVVRQPLPNIGRVSARVCYPLARRATDPPPPRASGIVRSASPGIGNASRSLSSRHNAGCRAWAIAWGCLPISAGDAPPRGVHRPLVDPRPGL
jgi:hypothetical protein